MPKRNTTPSPIVDGPGFYDYNDPTVSKKSPINFAKTLDRARAGSTPQAPYKYPIDLEKAWVSTQKPKVKGNLTLAKM
jgi:hypothetical protein